MAGRGLIKQGAAARKEIAEAKRLRTSRVDMARHPRFAMVSPRPSELDESAFELLAAEDPDSALELLTEMTGAVDPVLRRLATKLAGRVLLRMGQGGTSDNKGAPKLTRQAATGDGDLDVEASLDAIIASAARQEAPSLDNLVERRWTSKRPAAALVIDRSGSMGGARLATAALAASVLATRMPADHCVLAFSGHVTVVKDIEDRRCPADVVEDLLALRGQGTTDAASALFAARLQLARSQAGRKIAIMLSDCRHNGSGDPALEGAWFDEVVLLAPATDSGDARRLARRMGARLVAIKGPSSIPAALTAALR
ncbi:MAG: VWA domain-containing protein [Actinobacteria bacterium]|nr:VWA domain-containing protein [Actinomycetota bacterium]